MRRITTCLLWVLLLSCATVPKEVSLKLISNPDGTIENVFYSDGKEVTRQIVKHGRVIQTIGKIPDGIVKEYYESGKIKAEWEYKNHSLDGVIRQYYESGGLSEESEYKNNRLDGVIRQYYESGGLFSVSNYKDGKEEGTSMMYHENGTLWSELNYRENQLDGISKIYDENGKL